MADSVTFGCTIPASGPHADAATVRDLAQTAEALGFDSVWVSDHIVIPVTISSPYPYSHDGAFRLGPEAPYLEPLTVLTYLAGHTQTIRLGTHVLILPYRNPVLTAKIVATLDALSGGRVDLGIGVGWMEEEFQALGYDYFARRGAVTDEQIRVLKMLWTEAVPSFDGEFYSFPPIGAYPQPAQKPHPPIWVGGHSQAAIRRAARLGDGWLPIGARPPANLPPEEVAAGIELLHAEAKRVGRAPSDVQVCFSTQVSFSDARAASQSDRAPFHGTPDQLAADFDRYRAVGVTRFVVGFGSGTVPEIAQRMQRFAGEVQPALG